MLDIITATRKCLKKQKVEVSEDNCVLGTFLIHFLIVILHVYSKQLRSVLGKFLRHNYLQIFNPKQCRIFGQLKIRGGGALCVEMGFYMDIS